MVMANLDIKMSDIIGNENIEPLLPFWVEIVVDDSCSLSIGLGIGIVAEIDHTVRIRFAEHLRITKVLRTNDLDLNRGGDGYGVGDGDGDGDGEGDWRGEKERERAMVCVFLNVPATKSSYFGQT